MKNLFILLFALGLGFSFAEQKTIGNFAYESSTDAFTDEHLEALTLNDVEDDYRNGQLVFFCSNESLSVMFVADEYLTNDDESKVKYRFDKGDVRKQDMFVFNSGDGVVLPSFSADDFLKKAVVAQTLAVQLTNYNDEVFTYMYDLTGINEAVSELSCTAQFLQ